MKGLMPIIFGVFTCEESTLRMFGGILHYLLWVSQLL